VRVTADRGFAEVALVEVLTAQGVEFILRVKGNTQVYFQGQWRPLRTLGVAGNTRWRTLGRRASGARAPHRLWVTLSRVRAPQEQWDTGYLISNRCRRAQVTAAEDARRFGCAQGFRDTKWALGFAQARIKDSHAWSRLFALFALALLVVVSLAMKLLAAGGPAAVPLLRRVASRRRGRWDLSIVSAMARLLQESRDLLAHLSSHIQFNLDARLIYVS
jgi:Transposase DDE domain